MSFGVWKKSKICKKNNFFHPIKKEKIPKMTQKNENLTITFLAIWYVTFQPKITIMMYRTSNEHISPQRHATEVYDLSNWKFCKDLQFDLWYFFISLQLLIKNEFENLKSKVSFWVWNKTSKICRKIIFFIQSKKKKCLKLCSKQKKWRKKIRIQRLHSLLHDV